MKTHTVSLINAILLIALSLWGYLESDTASFTAFIPAIAGCILLFCYNGIKKENKVIAHIAVVVTLLIFMGLIKPLMGVIDRSNTTGIIRVVLMMLSSIVALIYFVRSFIEARRNRKT